MPYAVGVPLCRPAPASSATMSSYSSSSSSSSSYHASSNVVNYGHVGSMGMNMGMSSHSSYSASSSSFVSESFSASSACMVFSAPPKSRGGKAVESAPNKAVESGCDDQLQVTGVNFMVDANVYKHHTNEFDITEKDDPELVVRRGQEFTIQVDFNRAYNIKTDDLRMVFQFGKAPKQSKGTHVEFILSAEDIKGEWGAMITQNKGSSIVIAVFTPPDCMVGRWQFKVDTVKVVESDTAVFRYNHNKPIYMLFNPWCQEDAVYMKSEEDLEEYILNETGKLYAGTPKQITPKPWVFGQFSSCVLDCVMDLLDNSTMKPAARGDPVLTIRKLTALVNAPDDNGVLVGNWSGNYTGGKSPLKWTGSVPILEQFYESGQPVKFGQCWVFSGVLTTVARALGIPARSVTNFDSAHDADTSITIDVHFDTAGNSLDGMNEDSIWNFHVWNEAWMARADLPAGYDGWQACDSTPQETSDGIYCCGPCSVKAIKDGEVTLPYDGQFIFAEVNADRVYWLEQDDGTSKTINVETNCVGKSISTLSKTGTREDLTCQYKHAEGSKEERAAVIKANRKGSSRSDVYGNKGQEDVVFEVDMDEGCVVGSDFSMNFTCSNNTAQTRTVDMQVSISAMYYTGLVADQIMNEAANDLVFRGLETKVLNLIAKPEQYIPLLKDCCMLAISACGKVRETGQVFTKKLSTKLCKPELSLQAPAKAKRGQQMEVKVAFSNPLPNTLTGCFLEVEGPGLCFPLKFPQGEIGPNGTFSAVFNLTPRKIGKREVTVLFHSVQLDEICGSKIVTITP